MKSRGKKAGAQLSVAEQIKAQTRKTIRVDFGGGLLPITLRKMGPEDFLAYGEIPVPEGLTEDPEQNIKIVSKLPIKEQARQAKEMLPWVHWLLVEGIIEPRVVGPGVEAGPGEISVHDFGQQKLTVAVEILKLAGVEVTGFKQFFQRAVRASGGRARKKVRKSAK